MKIIVTGGAGFIGSNFIRSILKKGQYEKVINIDKMTYSANPQTTLMLEHFSNYEFVNEDICNASAMNSIIQEDDIVVNFAAESHVDKSIENQNIFIETNILGVQSLLSAVRKKKAYLYVNISTDEVYGSLEFNQKSSKETDVLKPSSPYSASKAAGEMLCFAAMKTFDLPIIITRSSNNFGPYQFPEKIIPFFITKLLNNENVPVYGNGTNVRDWIYVDDNCDAIDFLINNGKTGEIYNIGGGNEVSNIDLTKILLRKMNLDENRIEFVKDRLGHDLRYSLDCSKIHKLGWYPKNNFEESIDATIEWYIKHHKWWTPLIRKIL